MSIAISWGWDPYRHAKLSLLAVFVLWKSFLFIVAVSSPGPDYDTSTTLLHGDASRVLQKFIRWDAVYFTELARREYLFEQEWAFSWVHTRMIKYSAVYLQNLGLPSQTVYLAAGIVNAHLFHLATALVLFELTLQIFSSDPAARTLALLSATLHVLSPAGLFLSAPYTEGAFSFLHFLGCLGYVKSHVRRQNGSYFTSDVLLILSGISIGLATSIRSNGIASGIYFAHDAVIEGFSIIAGGISFNKIRKLSVVVLSGCMVAFGLILPQYIAYQRYCTTQLSPRPWCNAIPPSIYAFVQRHYWDNGFLKYWTIPNLPLFAMAAPTLTVLAYSSLWAFNMTENRSRTQKPSSSNHVPQQNAQNGEPNSTLYLMAAPQAFITIFTLTSSHVQIATRMASGYPVWYWWIASLIVDANKQLGDKSDKTKKMVIRWMIMYAVIQGGLYASFLPPA